MSIQPPQHVAIIMDGNGRWAEARGRIRPYGHMRGARTAKKIITACVDRGIKNLTLFAFSTENWQRPQTEVDFLMRLLAHQITREQGTLMKNNVRFHIIGAVEKLPHAVKRAVKETISLTAANTGMNLVFAVSYSGKQEITCAVQKLVMQAQAGQLRADQIDEALISRTLESSYLPDPDLLIRTSGELRLSNFFLWQAAYSELFVVEKHWPDFTPNDLDLALLEFSKRNRRYGNVLSSADTPAADAAKSNASNTFATLL